LAGAIIVQMQFFLVVSPLRPYQSWLGGWFYFLVVIVDITGDTAVPQKR
jgi:hypothetical protein